MEETTYIYTTSEVSKRIGTSASSIRKYSAALESHGHTFRIINNGRRFAEADIALLTRLRDLSAEMKMPIDQLARLVIDKPAAPQSAPQAHEQRGTSATPAAMPVDAAVNAAITAAIADEFAALRKDNAELKSMVERLLHEVEEVRQAVEAPPQIEAVEEEEIDLFADEDTDSEPELVREPAAAAPKRFWQIWKK